MPSVPTLVSGGISLGVLAGFLSSVYYVVLAGLKWFGNLQLSVESGKETLISDKNNCTRCDCSLTEGKVRRISCGHLVCRQCSIGTPTGDRVCTTCNKFQEAQQQTADWFYEQLKQRFFNKGTVAAAALSNSDGAQDGEVRDFMESIVEGLVGEGLDNVCLRPVSIHPNYIKFCDEFHDQLAQILAKFSVSLHMAITDKPLSHTDSPSFIHGELKELIKQIMRETSTLPSFHVFSNGSLEKSIDNEAGELEKKSYEDILATAILNKVVERHQQGLNKFVSNTQISVRDTNDNVVGRNIRRRRRRYKLTNKPIRDCRTQNSSSDSETNDHNFPNSCDDCNWSGSTKSDPLSFTVEECIEEVVTKYSSEDEPDTGIGKFLSSLDFKRRQRAPFPEFGMDIVDGRGSSPSSTADEDEEENDGLRRKEPNIHASMEMISQVDSWEENWLFQKKRLKTAGMNHSMPVPMLVPNPTEEYRVLIGEIDAEETSDLSECSDSALEDLLDGPGNNVSSVHSESEHELENTDAEDEFLMQLYKANKPLIHNGFSMQNGGVLESADLAEDCDETDCKTEICSEDIQFKSKNPVFNLNEAKNNELIVPQVDSGEGSLEIQQDSEYTEAYDSAAQLSVSKNDTGMSQTDTDRNTANDTKNSSEERRIEPEESTPDNTSSNGVDNQNQEDNDKANDSESENFDLFSAPPRPGTIAEREHKKWLQAVPLTNNPYSKENIERRQRERMLLRRQTSNETSVEFPELTGENNSSVVPIDCSGCKPNHKQYGRDYYINSSEQKEVSDGDVDLEASLLRGSVMHIASRVHGSSPNFTLNPLFEDTDPSPQHKIHKTRPESGYASSVESGNSSMIGWERLSSLPEPQVVEYTFENLNTLRKSQHSN